MCIFHLGSLPPAGIRREITYHSKAKEATARPGPRSSHQAPAEMSPGMKHRSSVLNTYLIGVRLVTRSCVLEELIAIVHINTTEGWWHGLSGRWQEGFWRHRRVQVWALVLLVLVRVARRGCLLGVARMGDIWGCDSRHCCSICVWSFVRSPSASIMHSSHRIAISTIAIHRPGGSGDVIVCRCQGDWHQVVHIFNNLRSLIRKFLYVNPPVASEGVCQLTPFLHLSRLVRQLSVFSGEVLVEIDLFEGWFVLEKLPSLVHQVSYVIWDKLDQNWARCAIRSWFAYPVWTTNFPGL